MTPMDITLTTPALLFPALSLLMLAMLSVAADPPPPPAGVEQETVDEADSLAKLLFGDEKKEERGRVYFEQVYAAAEEATAGFTQVTEAELTSVLISNPRTLLVFRTIIGLTKGEFAHATIMALCFGLLTLGALLSRTVVPHGAQIVARGGESHKVE